VSRELRKVGGELCGGELAMGESGIIHSMLFIRVKVSLFTGEFWHFFPIYYDHFYSRKHSSRSWSFPWAFSVGADSVHLGHLQLCFSIDRIRLIYGHKQISMTSYVTNILSPHWVLTHLRGERAGGRNLLTFYRGGGTFIEWIWRSLVYWRCPLRTSEIKFRMI